MRAFIQLHLDPATRLGECLFGLIMALGITGAVRLGTTESTCRELFVAVLGCNLAWGVVDGVMFVMLALFERGRKSRIANNIATAANDETAIEFIKAELEGKLEPLTTLDKRERIYREVLDIVRHAKHEPPRVQSKDLLGGLAVGVLVLLATLPLLLPFVMFSNVTIAVRLSNGIALGMMCWLGFWWASIVGANPYRISAGVTTVGLTLVAVTIALGG